MAGKVRILGEEKRKGNKYPVRVLQHLDDVITYSKKEFSGKFGVMDYESTDVDNSKALITEIGLAIFSYDPKTFEIGHLIEEHSELNDPEVQISEEVTFATGIDNDTVKGHKIDIEKYKKIYKDLDFIICHNAIYDRGISERFIPSKTMYLCSLNDIDYKKYNYPTRSLTDLLKYNGVYFDAHRAVTDCKALYWLLQTKAPAPDEDKTFFQVLMGSVTKERFLVLAQGNTYPVKDKFKPLNMRWFTFEKGRDITKGYQKLVNSREEALELVASLKEEVYNGNQNPPISLYQILPENFYHSVNYIIQKCQKYILPKERKEFAIRFRGIPREQFRTFLDRGYDYTKAEGHPLKGYIYMLVTSEEYNKEKAWAKKILGDAVDVSHINNPFPEEN